MTPPTLSARKKKAWTALIALLIAVVAMYEIEEARMIWISRNLTNLWSSFTRINYSAYNLSLCLGGTV